MKRTDLALEAHALLKKAKKYEELPGVRTETKQRGDICTTVVQVLDAEGEKAMGKARGTYVTMELPDRRGRVRTQASAQLAGHLAKLLPEGESVLVVGLGNRAVTPDALGSKTVEGLLVTGHLAERFSVFRPVTAFCPGVKGQTGMESLDVIRGVVERTKPGCLIAVDALVAADAAHIGTVVQLSDAGIQPGSGVGNRRAQLDKSAVGVPVYALGVPTVTDLDEAGSGCIVTTADVDALVSAMAAMLGDALNRALQPGLSEEELREFLM